MRQIRCTCKERKSKQTSKTNTFFSIAISMDYQSNLLLKKAMYRTKWVQNLYSMKVEFIIDHLKTIGPKGPDLWLPGKITSNS